MGGGVSSWRAEVKITVCTIPPFGAEDSSCATAFIMIYRWVESESGTFGRDDEINGEERGVGRRIESEEQLFFEIIFIICNLTSINRRNSV